MSNARAIPTLQRGFARNLTQSAYPSLWKGLVGYWGTSLGVQGAILNDFSGFRRNGTLTSMDAPTDWAVGKYGWALDYDGTNDYVGCGLHSNHDFGSGDFSVAARIYDRGTGTFDAFVARFNNALNVGWSLEHITTTRFSFNLTNAANGTTRADFNSWTTNAWHYVVGVRRAGVTEIWVDGVKGTDNTASGNYDSANNELVFGKNPGGDQANGLIGDIGLWNRSLTRAEIVALSLGASPLALRQWVVGKAPGGLTLSVSDSFSLSDSLAKEPKPVFSDSFSLADVRALLLSKTLSDGITLADALALSSGKYASDSFSLADALSKQPGKVVTDSFSLSDSATILLTLILTVTDSFSLSDAATKSLAKNLLDTLSLQDALAKLLGKNISDTITLSDVIELIGGTSDVFGGPTTMVFNEANNFMSIAPGNTMRFNESANWMASP